MKMRRMGIALSLVGTVACGEGPTPTAVTAVTADGVNAARDGGLVVGSGNRSGQDSTATNQESSTAGDGGLVVGSGN